MTDRAVHRIHLKGPWEYEYPPRAALQKTVAGGVQNNLAEKSTASPEPLPPGRVIMPADWHSLFGQSAGTALFRRRFHCPTHLDENERVEIVFDGVGGRGGVWLNGTELGRLVSADRPQRFDITPLLKPFNELAVQLHYDGAGDDRPGGLYAPVALEIFSTATLSPPKRKLSVEEPGG